MVELVVVDGSSKAGTLPDPADTQILPLTGDIQPGMSSTAQQFPTAASYPYHCDNHPGESGTVLVTP